MKLTVVLTGAWMLSAAVALAGDEPAVTQPEPEGPGQEIRAVLTSYMEAFNKQDLKTLATLWAEDGEHIDRQTGDRVKGRDNLIKDLEEVFKTNPGTRLNGSVTHTRQIAPNVIAVEGITTTSIPDQAPGTSSFAALLVKQETGWVISSVEELPVPVPATAHDALKELEWLIGEWKDESEGTTVSFSNRWGADGSFLISVYGVERENEVQTSGTQIIGWDPRGQQFRSWTFNADGSFGSATWSKNDGDWMIKSTQTLANGDSATGTHVLTPVDTNTFTIRLIGHQVEGELLPASEAVTIVRVAAEPSPEITPATNSGNPAAVPGTPNIKSR